MVNKFEINSLYLNGMSIHDISMKFNITKTRVRQIVKNLRETRKVIEEKEKYTELFNQFISFINVHDRMPTKKELGITGRNEQEFVSIRKIFLTKGFNRSKITEEKLIRDLQRISKIVKRTPTRKDVIKFGKFSITAHYRVFDSLSQSQISAGLVPNKRGRR